MKTPGRGAQCTVGANLRPFRDPVDMSVSDPSSASGAVSPYAATDGHPLTVTQNRDSQLIRNGITSACRRSISWITPEAHYNLIYIGTLVNK
jgi:hypothetical protein